MELERIAIEDSYFRKETLSKCGFLFRNYPQSHGVPKFYVYGVVCCGAHNWLIAQWNEMIKDPSQRIGYAELHGRKHRAFVNLAALTDFCMYGPQPFSKGFNHKSIKLTTLPQEAGAQLFSRCIGF